MEKMKLYDLLAKKNAGEITEEELQELNKYLAENFEAAAVIADAQKVWKIDMVTKPLSAAYKEERWASLQKRISDNKATVTLDEMPSIVVPFYKRKIFTAIAAACVIAVISVVYLQFYNGTLLKTDTKQNVVSTKSGSRSKLEMPDGTQVWLNADSKITYDNNSFGKNIREVTLVGEAFFDVVKDKEHPFVIHTKAMDIKVLGTAFNVKAYPTDKRSEATLIHGSIEVSFKNRPTEKLILKPSEKISVNNDEAAEKQGATSIKNEEPSIFVGKLTLIPADSSSIETAWTKNRLIFKGKTFEDLAADLERWYNIKIIFKDSLLKQRTLTGTFQDETISEVLEYLKFTSRFKYEYDKPGKVVYIHQ